MTEILSFSRVSCVGMCVSQELILRYVNTHVTHSRHAETPGPGFKMSLQPSPTLFRPHTSDTGQTTEEKFRYHLWTLILHIYILAWTMQSAEVSDAARCRCLLFLSIHHPSEAATCRLAASCFRPPPSVDIKLRLVVTIVSSVTCENSIWNNKNNNCVFNIPTQMSNVSPPPPPAA